MANVVPFAFKQGILKAQHDFTTIVAAPGAGGAGQGTPVVGAYRLALYTFNGGTPPFTSASSFSYPLQYNTHDSTDKQKTCTDWDCSLDLCSYA